MTESELIAAAKSGDTHAYEELVRSYQDVAWRTALVILRDRSDAEDAVQTALVKMWQHLDSFRDGSPFRPWLLKIVANEARNLRTSRQRKAKRIDPGSDLSLVRHPSPDPETILIVAERSAELVRQIDRLPERDRMALYCRFVLDLNEPEMAVVLDCARGTVKSRLHRALGRLREAMLPAGDEEAIP